jgi:predicted permease
MDDDLDAELGAYFDELVARHRAAGLGLDEARRAATREMGAMHEVKRAVRASWVASAWDAPARDVAQAWRSLRQTPGLSAVAVLTFALGIGAAAAVAGVVSATLFTPPPYRDPSRLVLVWSDLAEMGFRRAPLSGPELRDLRTRTTSFDGLAALWANSTVLTSHGAPEFVRVGLVTSDYFRVLGVEPALGRGFTPADEVAEAPRSILLSWALWQRRFGGDAGLVGRTIMVDDRPVHVVGVLPPAFRLRFPPDAGVPDRVEAYLPFGPDLENAPRGQKFLRVVGRLRAGATLPAARADVDAVAASISREFAEYARRPRVLKVVGLEADATAEVRAPLWVLAAGAGLLLVVAAVNVLGVLVARAAARRREIAVRIALGAGVWRLLRLSLVEGLTLASLGAILGIAAARAMLAGLLALQPAALRRLADPSIDWRVLGLAAGLAVAWAALFALAPLLVYARTDVAALLASARGEAQRLRLPARSAFVVAQVALAVVLLVSAGLLVRTFARIQAIDPGFRAAGVHTFRVPAATDRHRSPEAREVLARRVRGALLALPSVIAAGATSHLPYDSIPNWGGPYVVEGDADRDPPTADYRAVSPGYFEATGITLLGGRAFDETDGPGAPPVAIVDETLAARAWPGQDALGKRLRVDPRATGTPEVWVTVVGVVRHVRHRSLVERLGEQVYFPLAQAFRNPVAYAVRAAGDHATVAGPVRAALREVDPRLPVYEEQPLAAYLDRAREVRRYTMTLAAAYAAVAIALAAVGVYGVVAWVVVQRRREYGVRLALGGTRGHVMRLVLGEGARLTAAGAIAGLAASVAAGRLLQDQLFGIAPLDAITYLAALPLLAAVALFACWWPARRATSADVLDILRAE